MTNQNIIRLLSGLTFLIFFCPFFQMCSDKSIMRKEVSAVAVNTSDTVDTDTISTGKSKPITTQIPKDKIDKAEQIENKDDKDLNAYELASVNFREIDKLTLSDILDSGFVFFSLYTLIILFSLIIFINALRKRIKAVFNLSLTNLFLAISSLIMFICDPFFEELSQIKFGYYLFIINTIALIIFSRKIRSKNAI